MFGPQNGVALVITLIMLAVITFMAVTFLAVSRREAGSVNLTRDQTTARLASDTALERVKAEISAGILSTTNAYNFDLLVSTNFVNWDGYDPTRPIGIPNVNNVNYGYKVGGSTVFSLDEQRQNLANLLYNARPPVFITTNRNQTTPPEFRFYLDLNRNRLYDTNGLLPVFSGNAASPFYDTNGNLIATFDPGRTASNNFIGDPEWIGILERPNLPHSVSNRFIARYAYIVVPSGKTLDVNYVHNQAKTLPARTEGFLRNQGVGSWEINLAAFLVDLNTNMWLVPSAQGGYGSPYFYNPNLNNIGAGFDDAFPLLRYRYGIAVSPLPLPTPSVQYLFGTPGATAFGRDFLDGYTRGPLMTNYWGWGVAADQDTAARTSLSWSGGDTRFQYSTTQDFYDKTKTSVNNSSLFGFTDRLLIAGTNNPNNSLYGPSSYDRYTFYRLLAQLGTDSATEPADKINLNYINVGPFRATNFISWDDPQVTAAFGRPGSEVFFTNAAHKLLIKYSGEWLNANSNVFFATYRTNTAFGMTNIPVFVNSNFVYTPSIHRLLQLAANITDATNRTFPNATTFPFLPSVFRPVVRRLGSDVYVVGYTSVDRVTGGSDPQFAKPLDLNNPAERASVPIVGTPPVLNDINVYGVPWVIGAKKGLPNFNEYAMQTVFQVTRKLEIRRATLSTPQSQWTTNMMYVVGVSNVVGAEAWNSYRTNFSRAVDIFVVNDMFMELTNASPINPWGIQINTALVGFISVPATGPQQWRRFVLGETNSFLVPLRTNITLVPDQPYRFDPPGFITDQTLAWVPLQAQVPQWKLAVNSKLRFIMVDKASQRVVDYVQLDGLNNMRDVSEEIRDPDDKIGFEGLWSTNLLTGNLSRGILNQITISLGLNGGATTEWKPYDLGSHSTKEFEIEYFRVLYPGTTSFKYPFLVNTSLWNQVPFSPTKRVQQHLTWQANDPLVHYTPGDLAYLATADSLIKGLGSDPPINNIGRLNTRYEPWGGSPDRGPIDPAKDFNIAIKDAGVSQSDDWQFPTNKFPNIGWLGRVHRGTPWQTIYMKSSDLLAANDGLGLWTNWTGNRTTFFLNPTNYVLDATRSVPASDRMLFDLFTTAFNENATRGQLSVNQSGLASWSALFTGVVALTNSSTDPELGGLPRVTRFNPWIIDPVGTDGINSPLFKFVDGINRERNRVIGTNAAGQPIFAYPGRTFRHVGDILSVPELSVGVPAYVGTYPNGYWTNASPFLNLGNPTVLDADRTTIQQRMGINDAVYEWLPQQVMSLLQVGEPRFVVYSYGQTLRPAPASIITSGTFQGMCTNYQVTAEMATRAVLRIVGSPDPSKTDTNLPPAKQYPPHVVIEKFNLLPPD